MNAVRLGRQSRMKYAKQVAERAVISWRFGAVSSGLQAVRGMIVLDGNRIASRIVPAGVAPIHCSAAHDQREEDGKRLPMKEATGQLQEHF